MFEPCDHLISEWVETFVEEEKNTGYPRCFQTSFCSVGKIRDCLVKTRLLQRQSK